VRARRTYCAIDGRTHWNWVFQNELDELWSCFGKKQRRVRVTDSADFGDQYVFMA